MALEMVKILGEEVKGRAVHLAECPFFAKTATGRRTRRDETEVSAAAVDGGGGGGDARRWVYTSNLKSTGEGRKDIQTNDDADGRIYAAGSTAHTDPDARSLSPGAVGLLSGTAAGATTGDGAVAGCACGDAPPPCC